MPTEQAGRLQAESPQQAIERAQQALKELQDAQDRRDPVGVLTHLAVWAVSLCAVVGLVVHTFFEAKAPQVDTTSVALLAVALIAPFVPRLKALEVGGAKAEWAEGATGSLRDMLSVLHMQQEAISQLFNEVKAAAVTGPDPLTVSPAVENLSGQAPARSLQNVLWVDDHPENNTYELDSLQESFTVITARSNAEAQKVLANVQIDAVISDIGRDDDSIGGDPGGVQLMEILRASFGAEGPPILYYTSEKSVRRYGSELEAEGAVVVTSLFSGLTRGLRQLEERNLEGLAAQAAAEVGEIVELGVEGAPDVIVRLSNGRKVGIEVGSWLQRPQMSGVAGHIARLSSAREKRDIEVGLLLHRPGVLDSRRREFAAQHVVFPVEPSSLIKKLRELEAGN
jgi:CheY-like chemotaxis protein